VAGNTNKKGEVPVLLTRKDVFLMSFLAILVAGLLFSGAYFVAANASGFTIADLSGEEEVSDTESDDENTEAQVEVTTETTDTEEETEEEIVIEEEVEELECEADKDCDDGEVCEDNECVEEEEDCEDVTETLEVDESFTFEGKTVKLKLVSEGAAQVSVGGKAVLISDSIEEINGIEVLLLDSDSSVATIKVYCPE
jgi:hypothetical protein